MSYFPPFGHSKNKIEVEIGLKNEIRFKKRSRCQHIKISFKKMI